MALIACWECESKISSTVSNCPHCGAASQSVTPLTTTAAVPNEVALQMEKIAKIQVAKQKFLEQIKSERQSDLHEKFYHSTEHKEKEHLVIRWQHFIVDEHEKDKQITTTVNKSRGVTTRGQTYVKDVNVQQHTTYYDYLDVKDEEQRVHKFRLIDLDLAKIKSGQLISLGWVVHQRSETPPVDLIKSGIDLGQTWENEIQPSLIVMHDDKERSSEYTYQVMVPKKFHDLIHSSSIRWWHLAWIAGVGLGFMADRAETGFTIAGIGAAISLGVFFYRQSKGAVMLKAFDQWYKQSAIDLNNKGKQLIQKVNASYSL